MADKSITKLDSLVTPASEDLAIIVTNASSAPSNKKSSLATFFNKIPTWLGLSTTPVVYTTGEIDVTTPVSFLSVTGSTTFSLPAGSTGQIKMLVCTVAASTPIGVVTPIASGNDGYDTFTFQEVGQSVTLIYSNSGWITLSSTASNFSQSYDDFLRLEDGVGTGEGGYSTTSTGEVLSQEAEDITGHLESKSFKLILERDIGTVSTDGVSTKEIFARYDATDTIIKQYDGTEVARIHDGATNSVTSTGTGASTLSSTATKGGFGFRKPFYGVTAAADSEEVGLTLAHSGALIGVTGAGYDLDIRLPAIAAGEEGWHIDVAITTAFSSSNNLEILTHNASAGVDDIFLYMHTAAVSGVELTANDDVLAFTDDVPAGTIAQFTCVKGGSPEMWIVHVMQPSGTAATTHTAST